MDLFAHHEVITIICLAFFPRLTLLLASFATGGFLWWLGWLFAPHLLVAILSLPYYSTHPVLVIIAWVFALGGSKVELKLPKLIFKFLFNLPLLLTGYPTGPLHPVRPKHPPKFVRPPAPPRPKDPDIGAPFIDI